MPQGVVILQICQGAAMTCISRLSALSLLALVLTLCFSLGYSAPDQKEPPPAELTTQKITPPPTTGPRTQVAAQSRPPALVLN